ncbi:MAG TPA: hypothetical protein VJP39_07730 [Gaiellaceae bacterium]|nr:hypothetical protein [Gaiellaceae bacterium]
MIAVTGASAGSSGGGTGVSGTPTVTPIALDDSQLKAEDATVGGAKPTPTDRTVAHWNGTTTDPNNGVTYSYNMVGSDPNNCSGSACSTTVQADITPLIVNIDGMTFDGTAVLPATLASPLFQGNDYGSTPAATAAGAFPNRPAFIRGPGGALSQGDAGNSLQLEDATMRAQFNQTGSSPYHLNLNPNVESPVVVNVPNNQGTLIVSGRGVVGADIDIGWWSSMIGNLETQADPTHLPIYLTNQVLLYTGNNPSNCCVIGYHGTQAPGNRKGNGKTQGNGIIQTFAWASWVQPGFYSRPDGGTDWALQDIHALSHEIAEWGDDPFVNNAVEPWLTPTAPQYGCTGVLETGDPVVGIGFAMGTNTFEQGTNPNGTQSADGYYHPEDETYLPWFMRTAPNTVSEPTQSPSANVGRYTLMGDLNPFPGFRQPATGC